MTAPAPSVATSNQTDNGVEIAVQAWVTPGDAGAVRADVVQRLHAMMRL